jgi:hypothetical protein
MVWNSNHVLKTGHLVGFGKIIKDHRYSITRQKMKKGQDSKCFSILNVEYLKIGLVCPVLNLYSHSNTKY